MIPPAMSVSTSPWIRTCTFLMLTWSFCMRECTNLSTSDGPICCLASFCSSMAPRASSTFSAASASTSAFPSPRAASPRRDQQQHLVDRDDHGLAAKQIAPRYADADLAKRAAKDAHRQRQRVNEFRTKLQVAQAHVAVPYAQGEVVLVKAAHKVSKRFLQHVCHDAL